MKNRLFVLILILFPFLTQAQESTKNYQLGFTLTPNTGWLRFNDSDPGTTSDGGRFGFSYGVLADLGLAGSNNYYFSTAFMVTSINGKTNSDAFNPGTSSYTYKVQYIEVPITLKLKSNEIQGNRFYGQFGLGTGIKVGAKGDGETLVGDIRSEDKDRNISDKINIFRLGLIAGAGAEWKVDRNIAIQTGVTFNNGFTDVFDGSPNARSSYFALNLGIFF